MLALPLIVALLGAEPTPEPTTAPKPVASGAPTPLTEIGRVRGRTLCTSIVVHANAAIDGTLDNDRTINLAIAKLATFDYVNANELERRRALADLDKMASQMRIQALNGEGEVRRLRELAAASTDAERKKELRDFADALGGALYRQRRMALDLQRVSTIMNGRNQVDEVREMTLTPEQKVARAAGPPRFDDDRRAARDSEQLRTAATELSARVPLVQTDEGTAADHALGATTGC